MWSRGAEFWSVASRTGKKNISDILKKRVHDLEVDLLRNSQLEHEERLREQSHNVACLQREHDAICQDLDQSANQLADSDTRLDNIRKKQGELTTQEHELHDRIAQDGGRLDELVFQVNSLTKKKDEAGEKMRNLTLVSSDMPRFNTMLATQLMKQLREINQALGKFEHVNKKAIDQFSTFKGQLEELETNQQKQKESGRRLRNSSKTSTRRKRQLCSTHWSRSTSIFVLFSLSW